MTGKTRGSPPAAATLRKLALLDAAAEIADLKCPSGNRLEKLLADRSGRFSIRVNDHYRICFTWRNHDAFDVKITDYH